DAGHARAALQRVQVALQADQRVALAGLGLQPGDQAVGVVEQVHALLDEDVHQVRVQAGEVEGLVGVVRRRRNPFGLAAGLRACRLGGALGFDALRGLALGFEALRFGGFGGFGGNALGLEPFGLGTLGGLALGFGTLCFGSFGGHALGFEPFGLGPLGGLALG